MATNPAKAYNRMVNGIFWSCGIGAFVLYAVTGQPLLSSLVLLLNIPAVWWISRNRGCPNCGASFGYRKLFGRHLPWYFQAIADKKCHRCGVVFEELP
ncbi:MULTISPECIES: hypothetical protein [Kordiimonas]|jgi:hypothetical protein|uniref:hypothetical protein n=1 Tax=Kordiimonas TaxID=288021 RepID=UPI00257B1DE8|nr:hypothetical protein [Kordiimonas sp. UBA4487]